MNTTATKVGALYQGQYVYAEVRAYYGLNGDEKVPSSEAFLEALTTSTVASKVEAENKRVKDARAALLSIQKQLPAAAFDAAWAAIGGLADLPELVIEPATASGRYTVDPFQGWVVREA